MFGDAFVPFQQHLKYSKPDVLWVGIHVALDGAVIYAQRFRQFVHLVAIFDAFSKLRQYDACQASFRACNRQM